MKRKIVKTLAFIFAAVLCFCIAIAVLNADEFGRNPFAGHTIEGVSRVCTDNNRGVVVIDNGGYQIVHINSENEVDAVIDGKSEAEDGFYFADLVCCDADSNIYVHSKELEQGSSIAVAREYVKKYSSGGKYIETVAKIEHENYTMRCAVKRIQIIDGVLCYFTVSDNHIIMEGADGSAVLFAYPEASTYVNDVLYSDGTLYFTTLNGLVQSIADGNVTELYNAPKSDSLSIPWSLTVDKSGAIYVCDIGYRTMQKLTDGKYECFYFNYEYTSDYTPELRSDSYIFYEADLSDGFLAINSDELVHEVNGKLTTEKNFSYSKSLCAKICVFYTAAALGIIALVYFIIIGAIAIFKSASATVKMSAFIILLTFIIAGLFVILTFGNFNDRLLLEVRIREDTLAVVLDKTLPKDSFLALDGLDSYNSDDYQAVKKSIDDLMLDDESQAGNLYCALYSVNNGVITLRYTLDESTGVNYPYDWDYADSDEEQIITTGEKKVYWALDNFEGRFMFVLCPIHFDDGSVIGLVEIGTNLAAFSDTNRLIIRDLLINILVMAVVIIMIAFEIITFINLRRKFKSCIKNGDKPSINVARANMLRIIVFIIFFVTNLTTCFLSFYAMTLAQEGQTILGLKLPAEILAAFPISAEVLTGALFSTFGSVIIKKFGRRTSGIIGGVLFTAGLCIRFLKASLLMLTVGNAIQGCGWGIVLLIINTMIAEAPDSNSVQEGFVNYNSACQNGLNCGVVFGGFLMRWLSYKGILIFAAALSVTMLVYATLYFTKDKLVTETEKPIHDPGMGFAKFIFKPRILLFFIAIAIPIIAANYYLNYLYPIIGTNIGMNETYLGYSYLLNGLIVICFGRILVKKLSRRLSRPLMLLLAAIIYFVAFAVVGHYQSILALLIALVALGIANGFGFSTQAAYYAELPEVKRFGYSRSMGVYSLFDNLSQMSGSFIFGYVLIIGLEKGLIAFGGIIVILAAVFALFALFSARRAKRTSKGKSGKDESALSQ